MHSLHKGFLLKDSEILEILNILVQNYLGFISHRWIFHVNLIIFKMWHIVVFILNGKYLLLFLLLDFCLFLFFVFGGFFVCFFFCAKYLSHRPGKNMYGIKTVLTFIYRNRFPAVSRRIFFLEWFSSWHKNYIYSFLVVIIKTGLLIQCYVSSIKAWLLGVIRK